MVAPLGLATSNGLDGHGALAQRLASAATEPFGGRRLPVGDLSLGGISPNVTTTAKEFYNREEIYLSN